MFHRAQLFKSQIDLSNVCNGNDGNITEVVLEH